MESAREVLEEARKALNLRPEQFARVIGVEESELQQIEASPRKAQDRVLRQAAEVFGFDLPEFLREGVEGRLATAMLRSFADHSEGDFDELVSHSVHRELGRFTRHLRRKFWLRHALGKPQPALPTELPAEPRPIAEDSSPPHGADKLASEIRAQLGLGNGPVPSMLSLMRSRLGIEVQFSTTLWNRIDGASVSTGQTQGVLVNVARGGHRWGLTRMTLAHELCHLLFDGGVFSGTNGKGVLIFSPAAHGQTDGKYRPKIGRDYGDFHRVEQRANAFAAYFLAPPAGVQALFPEGEPPPSWSTVSRVALHFGLSPLTAVNVLTNVYGWGEQRGDLIEEIDGESLPVSSHPDMVDETATQDRDFAELAGEAVSKRILFPTTRDRWLGLEASIPLASQAPLPRQPASTPQEANETITLLVTDEQPSAAIRVLWDSMSGWIDAEQLDSCRELMQLLAPATVDRNVMVSVLAVSGLSPALADERADYRAKARQELLGRNIPEAEVSALVGEAQHGE